jgi:hypothetical protein
MITEVFEVWSDEGLETRRSVKAVAEDDVRIFRWLGKTAWVKS